MYRCELDLTEARNLLRDYRAVQARCENGALLKEELARLNLRAFDLGLTLPPNSPLGIKFHEVVSSTSHRKEQGGLYAPMEESDNVRQWIRFLTEVCEKAPELTTPLPRVLVPPLF
jgi:hypothetical protein